MVLIGCISRSRGQKLCFQNAIFKHLLVWKYKAQSFHIWYITSSRGPLPIFGGQHKRSSVNGSTVTFDLFVRWATQGPLGPLVVNVICNQSHVYRCFWVHLPPPHSQCHSFMCYITFVNIHITSSKCTYVYNNYMHCFSAWISVY